MKREQLQREIAALDERINTLISHNPLPDLKYKPFPSGWWILTVALFAWSLWGGLIPGLEIAQLKTANWAWIGGCISCIIAVITTFIWIIRKRHQRKSRSIFGNSGEQVRSLQDRRRELQAQLRAMRE